MGIICIMCCVAHFLIPISSFKLINAQTSNDSVAYLSSSWINSPASYKDYKNPYDNSTLKPILFRTEPGPACFVCGFYCNNDWDDGCLFAILIFQMSDNREPILSMYPPKVVWSANRNRLVRVNATMQLTQEGNLILTEADGTLVWSTNTSGKLVSGLSMTESGNLVLFDCNNASVWQSFDHPTDSLLPDQKLILGKKLTSSTSDKNWTQGVLSFSVSNASAVAYVESNPRKIYFLYDFDDDDESSVEPGYVVFNKGGLFLSPAQQIWKFPLASSAQYMKLEPKGQLRVFQWVDPDWMVLDDIFSKYNLNCEYPLICGKYGICSDMQCSCPGPTSGETAYFRPIDHRQPDLGCYETTPLSCEASEYHSLLEVKDARDFSHGNEIRGLDVESCKQACLKNCSCKVAFFSHPDVGRVCELSSEIYSLISTESVPGYSTAFIKVQNNPNPVAPSPNFNINIPRATSKKASWIAIILGSSFGAFFGLLLIIRFGWFLTYKNKDVDIDEDRDDKDEDWDEFLRLSGMSSRFSHEMLMVATGNFTKKLGAGGCGSVFEGTFSNGTKVAVKCLDADLGQIKKSFLAEVETIGSIHHINLARLIGYCAEKSHRLLVYEYMCNGSLDKWIFCSNKELSLDWKIRKKIILDVAKGLAYLHEECRHKIIHLDIKPQNILLDKSFNAKVSDFGLCKLIDRDQTQVVTTMRGTMGYLAPEWLSTFITEKVDVYSFGVVILETLSGRKNLDLSQTDENMHLLSILKKKAEEKKLLDLVDKNSEDMQLHGDEVVEMMKVAVWCLQNDMSNRPSMSVVIKVLEGVIYVKDDLDYNFYNPTIPKSTHGGLSSHLFPSVLSGPRQSATCWGDGDHKITRSDH